MTALLVPIALDVLLVRDGTQPFAPTKMATPNPAPQNAKRQQLLPLPFGPDGARPGGAYLHWSLPDALTHTTHDGVNPPAFPAIPQRWLVVRITGDITAGPRSLTAWMLPDVNAQQPVTIAGVLGQPAPAPTTLPPAGTALTVLGQGDVSWSAYFDNVQNILSLYDPLTDVTGAVSYLVCGWYGNPELDPMQLPPAVSDASVFGKLDAFGWSLPGEDDAHDSASPSPTGPNLPTSIICHGAATGLGWPVPAWPGDGGVLAVEAGGTPQPDAVSVAVADTIVEAAAVLGVTIDGDPGDPAAALMLAATMAGMLSELAQPDGPAKIDTAQHAARFVTLPSTDDSETIWEPAIPAPPGSGGSGASGPGSGGSAGPQTAPATPGPPTAGLADAVRASELRAGVTAASVGAAPDTAGSLVTADRSTPRVFAPADPVIVLSGAQRSYNHGGDTRFGPDATLACRLSPSTVTWTGTAGSTPPDLATVLPAATQSQLAALGVPAEVFALLVETTALDPSCAPDLASATPTQPSPIAAARAAWLASPQTPPPLVQGVLPSPVGIIGPVHPWTPMHVEWALDWTPASAGVNAFTLGDVDFVTPDSASLPATGPVVSYTGRSLLSSSPARIAAGGTQAALAHLRQAGLLDDHPFADQVAGTVAPLAAAGGAAATSGAAGAVSDQDLLGGSLEDFLAALRGQDTTPIVRPATPASTPSSPATSKDVLRAGFARLQRARVVDAFGQYVDLVGSSASTGADQAKVLVGSSQAVDGEPGMVAMLPRFNAPARVMLRYNDAGGLHQDASTSVSPLCGFVVPSALDGSLEFFSAAGLALGRLRPDSALGTVWEEDPGQPASAGRKPSEAVANTFLGQFADGILAADAALAAATPPGQQLPQTALAALNQLIDSTRWTVDPSGTSGDEHLALLLGHPVAVLRAAIRVDVQSVPATSNARTTSVPVKLGTLAHTQDGLLAYFVADDYSSAHAVDPAIGEVVPPTGSAITSPYVDLSPSFAVQPGAGVDLTLLATPAADVHATVGMLPQKSVGMRRDWVSAGLATLSPNWRYGPVLVDRKATRIPVAADVHGTWSWHRRDAAGEWATDTIVNANQTAIIPDDRMAVQYGWISLQLAPDPQFPGIPVQVSCITKPQPNNPRQRIKGLGGTNGDGSPWWMTLDAAIAMVGSGRFFFYVLDKDGATPNPIVVDVSAAGNKFLRTVFDDTTSNNLLSLPQCPGQS
jgi:hypothetical protein